LLAGLLREAFRDCFIGVYFIVLHSDVHHILTRRIPGIHASEVRFLRKYIYYIQYVSLTIQQSFYGYRTVIMEDSMQRRTFLQTALAAGAGVTLIGVKFLSSYLSKGKSSVSSATPKAAVAKNPISIENMLPGTTQWQIPAGKAATIQIQAYTSVLSVAPGQQMSFHVSTQHEGTGYDIEIYRMGWYQGNGGRLMTTVRNQTGQAQGYYDAQHDRLVDSPTSFVDAKTGLVEARWQPSYMLTIPANWTTGVYLVKLTDAQGWQTYTYFNVLGNSHATYAAVTADNTAAAYNTWGGHSLYDTDTLTRGAKVSLDRPSTQNNGSDQVLAFELNAVRWLERQGYDLSYMSSVDLHTNAAALLQHKGYISLGHDEYWTKEMRDGVENALDHGVGLAFLEANAIYNQVRLEPNSVGVPNRTVVCYKVLTLAQNLTDDPLYGIDNDRVTSMWRDPVINRPENALVGIMYSNTNGSTRGFPWVASPSTESFLLQGTGLQVGQAHGVGLVGYEWDRVHHNGLTPENLQILAISPTVTDAGEYDFSHTTYYTAPSGALVFATGSLYWTSALDDYRFAPEAGETPVIPQMQQLMSNVMDALIVNHGAKK
jgi:hypothetical protein